MAFFRMQPVFLAIVCMGLAACSKPAADTASTSVSLAVTLVRAQSRPVERSVVASGPITAWEEMQLGVELSGLRVTALNVDVGQAVHKGDVLLEIDHRTLDSDLHQAQAAVAEAQAGVGLAQANLGRGQQMAKHQLISASALDELRAAMVQAQAKLATAAAQRDGVQQRRDFASLRAPDDGIISKRMVQPGQVVSAGAEMLRLIRQGRLEWRPELPDAALAQVVPGLQVVLHDGRGQTIAGRVRAVSPGVDTGTRTGTVYAELPAPGALKAGAFVEGRIITSTSPGLMVPAAAVVMRDGYAYVFTVDEQQIVHRIRVRIGVSDHGQIELLDGIQPGQAVVATGAGFLGDGDRVRVTGEVTSTTSKAALGPASSVPNGSAP